MKINRNNYEVWFVDFLDGNLDEVSRQELYAFLKKNPDLAKELEQFADISLPVNNIVFHNKERLLKTEADLMDIDYPDYLLIKRMEEGLSHEEETQLEQLYKENRTLKNRDEEFQKTRLAGGDIVFNSKEKLLRKQVIPLKSMVIRLVAAASLLVMMFLGYKMINSGEKPTGMAMVPLEPINKVYLESDWRINSNSLVSVSLINYEPGVSPAEAHNLNTTNTSGYNLQERFGFEVEIPLIANNKNILLPVDIPNAYETGLRHMMPLYLDINNNSSFLVNGGENDIKEREESFLVRGLQFFDKVGANIIQFEQVFDEEGNFVAYNFKAGSIEMQKKVKR